MDDRTGQEIIARLDYMERYLVNLGQVSGYRYAPFVTTVALPEVAELARHGRTHDAIKLYRKQTDANAQQAQDVIGRIQAGDQPSAGPCPTSSAQDAGSFGAAPAGYDAEPSFGPLTPPAGGLGLPADVVAMAQAGRFATAVKTYRDRTGVSLQEAHATVRMAARGY